MTKISRRTIAGLLIAGAIAGGVTASASGSAKHSDARRTRCTANGSVQVGIAPLASIQGSAVAQCTGNDPMAYVALGVCLQRRNPVSGVFGGGWKQAGTGCLWYGGDVLPPRVPVTLSGNSNMVGCKKQLTEYRLKVIVDARSASGTPPTGKPVGYSLPVPFKCPF